MGNLLFVTYFHNTLQMPFESSRSKWRRCAELHVQMVSDGQIYVRMCLDNHAAVSRAKVTKLLSKSLTNLDPPSAWQNVRCDGPLWVILDSAIPAIHKHFLASRALSQRWNWKQFHWVSRCERGFSSPKATCIFQPFRASISFVLIHLDDLSLTLCKSWLSRTIGGGVHWEAIADSCLVQLVSLGLSFCFVPMQKVTTRGWNWHREWLSWADLGVFQSRNVESVPKLNPQSWWWFQVMWVSQTSIRSPCFQFTLPTSWKINGSPGAKNKTL